MLPATFLEPGVVQASSSPTSGLLDLGRYPSGVDATAEAIAAALRDSSFSSNAIPDIMRWKYCKLLMNLGNSAQALFGLDGGSGDRSASRDARASPRCEPRGSTSRRVRRTWSGGAT